MDEGRKRVLWICAALLAAPRLAELKDAANDVAQIDITYDAILKAERMIRQIDCRWPASKGPGMNSNPTG